MVSALIPLPKTHRTTASTIGTITEAALSFSRTTTEQSLSPSLKIEVIGLYRWQINPTLPSQSTKLFIVNYCFRRLA